MSFNPVTATARESELIAARKLTREEVAAAYHVPPAMIGIVEAQGYGSLREQHRALYQDTLGPIVALLEGEISRQLLSEFSDSDDTYVQFNIQEKLQGSFEEEQAALSVAVGSPYMTRNEARARMNLPRINDQTFDQPVTRLDIAEGQQNASLSIKDRIDALGGLIRAGFDPAESLEALDLPAIKHLGLAPVTVQPEEDEP
jgi:phage portal protein BeeE